MQEMQDMWVQPLGQKDPLEEGMATHSSILGGKIPWTEKPNGFGPWSPKDSDVTEVTEHTRHCSI